MDNPSPFSKPLAHDGGKKFADMTPLRKWVFVIKVVICVATFGYVFPNVQNE
ncbi:MAG TPA: hypothetical protein VNU64_08325 [Burkholderiales bacterium]|nr:hypothetical protein [Burkholderiales bacterium]